jgi:hypothetical protein
MSQTAYPLVQPVAFAGLIADLNQGYYIRTGLNEEVTEIPFGVALSKVGSSVDDGYKLPALAGSVIAGVSIHSPAINNIGSAGWAPTAGIPRSRGAPFNVLKRGTVWVTVEQAVLNYDIAFARFASGAGGTQLGAWRKDADTATAALVKGARFLTAQGTAAGLAVLDFDAAVAAS